MATDFMLELRLLAQQDAQQKQAEYNQLVRRVSDGAIEDPDTVQGILEDAGRTLSDFEECVTARQERRRLAAEVSRLPELQNEFEVAHREYLAAQATRKAEERRQADLVHESHKRRVFAESALAHASDAERELRRVIPPSLAEQWLKAEAAVSEARLSVKNSRAGGIGGNIAVLEETLAQAMARLEEVRREAFQY